MGQTEPAVSVPCFCDLLVSRTFSPSHRHERFPLDTPTLYRRASRCSPSRQVWLSPHPARLPAVKGKGRGCLALPQRAPRAGRWSLQPRDLGQQDPGFGSRLWHSSVFGVLLAGPGHSGHQAGEDAELFLLGFIPLSSGHGQSPAP